MKTPTLGEKKKSSSIPGLLTPIKQEPPASAEAIPTSSRVIKVCDEVPCGETPLDEANLPEIFKSICGGVEPTDTSTISRRVVQPYGRRALKHALVSAIHTAWVGNYPLVLTPDVIWTAIQQGQARDSSFVPPSEAVPTGTSIVPAAVKGKKRRIDTTGSSDHWPDTIQNFTKKLKEADPSTCTPSFSTSGQQQEKAVANLSLMNVHVKDYDYTYVHAYGIPTITLTGTEDDWTLLRDSALALASKCTNAPEWSQVLKPVLDQFISAASGEVDQKFWKSIYHCYGDKTPAAFSSSGWIFAFLPFVVSTFISCPSRRNDTRSTYTLYVRNKYLKQIKDQVPDCTTSTTPNQTISPSCISYVLQPQNSIRSKDIPSSILNTNASCSDLREDKVASNVLYSGFIAVSQDGETMAIHLEIGWAVYTHPWKSAS